MMMHASPRFIDKSTTKLFTFHCKCSVIIVCLCCMFTRIICVYPVLCTCDQLPPVVRATVHVARTTVIIMYWFAGNNTMLSSSWSSNKTRHQEQQPLEELSDLCGPSPIAWTWPGRLQNVSGTTRTSMMEAMRTKTTSLVLCHVI